MAYQFSRERRTVWWPAKVSVPVDGGQVEESEFELQIEIPKTSDLEELEKLPKAEARERMADRVKGWRGIVDEQGNAVPFTRENFAALVEDRWFESAVGVAMMQAALGARVKN